MPFREAHHVTGRIVALAAERGVALEKLTLAQTAGDRAAHHRVEAFGVARRRALREKPDLLRRDGPGQRQAPGESMAEASRGLTRGASRQRGARSIEARRRNVATDC